MKIKISGNTKKAQCLLNNVRSNLTRICQEGGMPTKKRIFNPNNQLNTMEDNK